MRFKPSPLRSTLPEDYIYWALQTNSEYYTSRGINLSSLSQKETGELVRDVTSSWHPSLKVLFEEHPTEISQITVTTVHPNIPVPEVQEGRVTLLGDAVHQMTPSAGIGASTALRVAAELVRLLVAEIYEAI